MSGAAQRWTSSVAGRAVDWLFRSRVTGRITIGQAPNLAIALFAIAYLAEWLVAPTGRAGTILWLVVRGLLGWWAADELLRGVNPWRRILGAGVLAYLAVVAIRAI